MNSYFLRLKVCFLFTHQSLRYVDYRLLQSYSIATDSTLSTLVVLVCYRPDCASTLFHRQIHRVSEKNETLDFWT